MQASAVPRMGGREGLPPALPRLTLRRKGLALFALVSLYVVAGAAALGWQALQSAGARADGTGRLEPVIVVALVVVVLGLVVFGSFLTLFLGRLSGDLGRVQARALEVASGERGAAGGLARDDEVGTLARAIESMATDLQAREAEIAESRVEQFHRERMMLLGGIAAGLAHEIGNPVAAIAAIAGEIDQAGREGRPANCRPGELVALADRLAAVTRRLADMAGPRRMEPMPVALDDLLENLVPLVALDPRFRAIDIERVAGRATPPIVAVEDDLLQLCLHLLVNAAEALGAMAHERPRIRIASSREGAFAVLEIADNGQGMDAATAARAFEPFFSTKPAGRGNGLGLDACRRIVERCGGEISLRSELGSGTRVTCRFPAAVPSARGACDRFLA